MVRNTLNLQTAMAAHMVKNNVDKTVQVLGGGLMDSIYSIYVLITV